MFYKVNENALSNPETRRVEDVKPDRTRGRYGTKTEIEDAVKQSIYHDYGFDLDAFFVESNPDILILQETAVKEMT